MMVKATLVEDAVALAALRAIAAGTPRTPRTPRAAGAQTTSKPTTATAVVVAAEPAAAEKRSFVDDVLSDEVDSTSEAAVSMGLPTTLAELEAAGGLERFIDEAFRLHRADYPILALKRLLRLEQLLPPLPLPEEAAAAAAVGAGASADAAAAEAGRRPSLSRGSSMRRPSRERRPSRDGGGGGESGGDGSGGASGDGGAAGVGSTSALRLMAASDARVREMLNTESQMAPQLEAMLDNSGWKLVSSKKDFACKTYVRPGESDGRMDIKVCAGCVDASLSPLP